MRIGLIADTHIPDHAKELPPQIKEIFAGVDLILHAGDVYEVRVLDELENIAPILVAQGDDDLEILGDSRVKQKHIISLDGVTIWLVHERRWSWEEPDWTMNRPRIIVFGHTHRSKLEYQKEGYLLINPGSATFPNYKKEPGSIGILTIDSGRPKAEIIQLKQS